MPIRTNIFRRGAVFYHRQVVPKDLAAIMQIRELKRSLRTSCQETARRLGAEMQLRAEFLFAYLRRKPHLLTYQSHLAIHAFYNQELEIDAAARCSGTVRPAAEDEHHWNALEAIEGEIVDALRRGSLTYANYLLGGSEAEIAKDTDVSTTGEIYHAILRTALEVVRRMKEREKGNWSGTPSDPLLTNTLPSLPKVAPTVASPAPDTLIEVKNLAQTKLDNEPSMEDLKELFFKEKRKVSERGITENYNKYENEFRASLEWLRQYYDGFKSPSDYTKRDFVTYKNFLLEVPTNFQKFYPRMNIKAAVAANKAVGRPTLNPKTIQNKRLGDLKTFFGWLEKNDYIKANPLQNVSVAKSKNVAARKTRLQFPMPDLNKIFNSKEFLINADKRAISDPTQRMDAHKAWLPLLAIYTGCRMAELAQLHCADVETIDGNLFLRITEENLSKAIGDENKKSIKNAGSDRLVPVHPRLIEIGFEKFFNTIKATGEVRLFPGCNRGKNDGQFSPYSKYFTRFLKEIEVKKDKMLTFHSFRHNFEFAMREAGINQHVGYQLSGRVDSHSSAGYGNGFSPARLLKEISKIEYPSLDLEHLEVKTDTTV